MADSPFDTLSRDDGFLIQTMADIEAHREAALDRPHRHDYYTVIWVRNARGVHHIDFQAHILTPETVYLISPEQVHLLVIDPGANPEGYVLTFHTDFMLEYGISPAFLDSLHLFFDCDQSPPLQIPRDWRTGMERMVSAMLAVPSTGAFWEGHEAAAWLKLFLLACYRVHQSLFPGHASQAGAQGQIVRDFKRLVNTQFATWHKVGQYASALRLSPNYLNEVIHQATGSSPKQYIQDRIMLEAKRLAIHTDSTLKEIAYGLGYQDPAHFSRYFKQCNGVSFSDFKAQIRKKYR